jgi:hypothetical protein
MNNQLIKVLAIVFILFIVWQIQKYDLINIGVEKFSNIYEEHQPNTMIINHENCYNKLFKENGKFYLVNTRRPIVLHKNPREFKSYNEYLHFAKLQKEKNGCPIIDITKSRRHVPKSNKNSDDPWETYQRRCNKSMAKQRHQSDYQLVYGEGYGINQNSSSDNKASYNYHEEYDVESCMRDMYLTEHGGLQASPL